MSDLAADLRAHQFLVEKHDEEGGGQTREEGGPAQADCGIPHFFH